jgi:signal transduction histidine kinase
MSRLRTLRGRLTVFALVGATIAVGLVVVAFNLVLARSLDRDVGSRLRAQAAAAATTVRTSHGRLEVRESPGDETFDSQVWVFEGRRSILRSPGPRSVQAAAAGLAGRSDAYVDVGEPDVRLYAAPVTRRGRQVGTVVAGQSLAAYDRTTGVTLIGTVALGGVLLGAVFAVTWLTIGRALRPVTDMTRSAASWGEHDLDRRFGTAPRPDELGQLARTFDALLDRVAASLRREQRLSAELSHELRTPLARIIAEMELLERRERSAADRREAYRVVAASAEQMSRILDTLIAAARADGRLGRGRSTLAEAFDQLAREWDEPFAQRGVELDIDADGVAVGVEAEVVERVIAPLLDNAGRYARSRVTVGAEGDGHRVRVTVRDDGPGLAAEQAEAIFEPGVGGGGANGHAGAGLGLALARRLARAAGGDVTVHIDGGAGGTFFVDLPA